MKKNLLLLLAGLIAGAALGISLKKPQIKTEIVEKEVVKTDVRTITKILERPDGTKETVIDTIDKSKASSSKSETMTKILQRDWLISAGAHIDYKLMPEYSLLVQRRVLGPLFAGLQGSSTGKVGLLVGMEF